MRVTSEGGGIKTFMHVQDGNLIAGTSQDCTAIAEEAKGIHNTGFQGPSSDMKLAGRIPLVLIETYCNRAGITLHEFTRSQEHKKRLLSDPANADFRIWKGRI